MNNDIFSDSAFDCLDSAAKEKLKRLSIETENMDAEKKLVYIITALRNMPEMGHLSMPQKKAMLRAVLSDMPENERSRLNMLFRFAGL